MELSQLRLFKAVASFQNLSRAAEFLGISQPAASRQLADLEEELKVSLFWRNRRHVEITEIGEAFLEQCEDILLKADRARTNVESWRHGRTGCLHLGFLAYSAGPILHDIVTGFREQHPGIRVILHEMNPLQMHQALVAGTLDAGFNREVDDRDTDKFDSLLISSDQLEAVLPLSHPAAGRDQVGLTELKDWDFIICQRSVATPLYDAIIQACLEAGFSPRIVSEAVTPHGVIFGVSGGSLVSITFSTMRHFFSKGVVFTPFSQPLAHLDLVLEYRKAGLSDSAAAFRDYVQARTPA